MDSTFAALSTRCSTKQPLERSKSTTSSSLLSYKAYLIPSSSTWKTNSTKVCWCPCHHKVLRPQQTKVRRCLTIYCITWSHCPCRYSPSQDHLSHLQETFPKILQGSPVVRWRILGKGFSTNHPTNPDADYLTKYLHNYSLAATTTTPPDLQPGASTLELLSPVPWSLKTWFFQPSYLPHPHWQCYWLYHLCHPCWICPLRPSALGLLSPKFSRQAP